MMSNILLVDENPLTMLMMGRVLSDVADVQCASDGDAAMAQIRKIRPDLILLDTHKASEAGYEVCRNLKSTPEYADIPVIFLTDEADRAAERRGMELGAADSISKPISESLLLARVNTQLWIRLLTDELRGRATIDPLTELCCRQRFDEMLRVECARAFRGQRALSMLLVDIDGFRKFNQTYGQQSGDACLRRVAHALAEAIKRPGDLVARYGVDQFVVLLPEAGIDGAWAVTDRLMTAVADIVIPYGEGQEPAVTASIGAVTFQATPEDLEAIHTRERFPVLMHEGAAKALQAAKSAGRSQGWWIGLSAEQPSLLLTGLLSEPEVVGHGNGNGGAAKLDIASTTAKTIFF